MSSARSAQRRRPRPSVASCTALTCSLVVITAACDDPYVLEWYAYADTATLHSIATTVPNLPNAFDFPNALAVILEAPDATGTWDVAVGTRNDTLVLLPPGALGVESYAAVVMVEGVSIDDVTMAPADSTSYVVDAALPLSMGSAYIVRSRQVVGYFEETCTYFSKLEPVELDPGSGLVRFAYMTNPNCTDPNLTPTS